MIDYMKEAIKEAIKAGKKGEIPVGAVIVYNGKIIARGRNKREKTQNALLHAEIVAINKACKKLHSWRLENADIYITLEPCPMCAGAISNARIKRVFYSASDNSDSREIIDKIFSSTRLNHKVELIQGEYQTESSKLLSDFFKSKRLSRKNKNAV